MIREIQADLLSQTVARLSIESNISLPSDITAALERARENDSSPLARELLGDICANQALARSEQLPICQDTGLCAVFIELGQDVHIIGGDFTDAVIRGVAAGYTDGSLRSSVLTDPLRRDKITNVPPVIHTEIVPGDKIKITVAPKGFGSENMSMLGMLSPSSSESELKEFISAAVLKAGAGPCPPVLVGVGLGGTADSVTLASKRALLREIGTPHPDPLYARLESELFCEINARGSGVQGFGGSTSALCVHIEALPTHIAGLPCAVAIGCHVTRRASVLL